MSVFWMLSDHNWLSGWVVSSEQTSSPSSNIISRPYTLALMQFSEEQVILFVVSVPCIPSVQIGAAEQSAGRVCRLSDLGSSQKSQTRILSTMHSLIWKCLFSCSEGKETIIFLFVIWENNYIFLCFLYLESHFSDLLLVLLHWSVVPSLYAQEVINQLSASVWSDGTEEASMWNGNEKTKT